MVLFRYLIALFFMQHAAFGTSAEQPFAFNISPTETKQISQLIWQNEGSGKADRLTWWGKGEDFASLGINHFIWYPKGRTEPFEESFRALLRYLQTQRVALPLWLEDAPPNPWHTRQQFMADFHSPRLKELRRLLLQTQDLQVQFLLLRLQSALPKILISNQTEKQFQHVLATKKGAYMLLDYYNFKGAGTLASERYNGQGWGLLQVLELMENDRPANTEFIRAAREALKTRVANSPSERNEQRWLAGWLKRIETYK